MASYEGIVDRVCNRTCDRFYFFDQKIAVEKLTGLTLLAERISESNLQDGSAKDDTGPTNYVSSLDKFTCQLCHVDFPDTESMREHFKSDGHVRTMNKSLGTLDKSNACYEREVKQLREPKDLGSQAYGWGYDGFGGNIDLTNSQPLLGFSSYKQMVYFRSRDEEIIGIYRCVLFTRKTLPSSMDELLSNVSRLRQSRRWAVLLYSGGKFAGGIFDGVNEVVHKTLHHYTVRAKQGGSQSSYDGSNSSLGGPKSAGATLRRHGEMAIRSEINQLLHNRWRAHLQACQYILVWSPKVHRNIFFSAPSSASCGSGFCNTLSPVDPKSDTISSPYPEPDVLASAACQAGLGMTADDLRVRRIPCRTNEITYNRVKELHKDFSSFYVYDKHADFTFLSQSKRKQLQSLSESGNDTLLETRSGRMVYGPLSLLERKLTKLDLSPPESEEEEGCESESGQGADSDQVYSSDLDEAITHLSIDASVNRTVQDAAKDGVTKGLSQTIDQKEQNELQDLYGVYHNWHRRVRVAIASGDQVALRSLLPEICSPSMDPLPAVGLQPTADPVPSLNAQIPDLDKCSALLNYPLTEGRTLLHMAVEFQQQPEVVQLLLERGCDPALCDAEGKTPYNLALTLRKKQLTIAFRRFRFFHPERYDYDRAQIPSPLDPISEAQKTNRERERQRKQRQRLKERKANERAKLQQEREEAEEKARFMALSDREKRALVAERRLLAAQSAQGTSTHVYSRCFYCGCDISGKVPFTYMDFNFCTPVCLKAHRMQKSNPS